MSQLLHYLREPLYQNLGFERLEAGVLGVGCDGLLNLECQGKGIAGLLSSDLRAGTGLNGLEEGFNFKAQRLTRGDVGLVHAQGGESGRCGCRFVRLPHAAVFRRGEVWGALFGDSSEA